jgi:2-hydroxy-6-oxonona-2,4-dienedioate hydrolase
MATMWGDLQDVQFEVAFPVVAGVRTRVLAAGSGPVLLLLHGTGGHLETYQRNIRALAEHFRVLVPDMIGHGYTDRPARTYTLDTYADHMFALLEHLRIDRFHASGESVGGCVAAWMALREPARVSALVLNTGILERPSQKGLQQLADLEQRTRRLSDELSLESVRRRLEWLVHDRNQMTDEMVQIRYDIYAQPGMVADVQKIMHAVLQMNRGPYGGVDYMDRDRLRAIQCPTLVLWSDHNPGKPYQHVKPAIDLIPAVKSVLIDNAAHWPQFERPDAVNRHMVEFLRRLA